MTKLQHLRPLLLRTSRQQNRIHRFAFASDESVKKSDNDDEPPRANEKASSSRPMYIPEAPQTIDDIAEPTTCCMSGCANCVWIEYAEKLSTVLKGSRSDVQKAIMDKVQDPNMRAFLSMELRVRKLIE